MDAHPKPTIEGSPMPPTKRQRTATYMLGQFFGIISAVANGVWGAPAALSDPVHNPYVPVQCEPAHQDPAPSDQLRTPSDRVQHEPAHGDLAPSDVPVQCEPAHEDPAPSDVPVQCEPAHEDPAPSDQLQCEPAHEDPTPSDQVQDSPPNTSDQVQREPAHEDPAPSDQVQSSPPNTSDQVQREPAHEDPAPVDDLQGHDSAPSHQLEGHEPADSAPSHQLHHPAETADPADQLHHPAETADPAHPAPYHQLQGHDTADTHFKSEALFLMLPINTHTLQTFNPHNPRYDPQTLQALHNHYNHLLQTAAHAHHAIQAFAWTDHALNSRTQLRPLKPIALKAAIMLHKHITEGINDAAISNDLHGTPIHQALLRDVDLLFHHTHTLPAWLAAWDLPHDLSVTFANSTRFATECGTLANLLVQCASLVMSMYWTV